MAQICFQVNLTLCYITTIASHLLSSCAILTYIYIYTFLCTFTFLLVESLIILHKLVDKIILGKLERSLFVVLLGFLPPLFYSTITIPFLSPSDLATPDHQSL